MSRASKREREAIAEPTPSKQQASMPQNATDDLRARVWEAHLRGVAKAQIARAESLDRQTVTRIITACYAEIADERKRSNKRKLDGAVGRMRRLQEQAWADHDADDERERQVLSLSLGSGNASNASNASSASSATIRFQSQRSQYLRIILDAEKEIARLEGLYENILDVDGAIGFVVVRRAQSDSPSGQSGQIASSVAMAAIQPPSENPTGGEA